MKGFPLCLYSVPLIFMKGPELQMHRWIKRLLVHRGVGHPRKVPHDLAIGQVEREALEEDGEYDFYTRTAVSMRGYPRRRRSTYSFQAEKIEILRKLWARFQRSYYITAHIEQRR